MGLVKDILKTKNSEIVAVSPTTTVYQALEKMVEKNISALLVMEGDQLKGIFTERDYARKVILKGKESKKTEISEIMTANLITVSSMTSIEDCMKIMTSKYIRHLPVVDGANVSGIISIGDVVRFVIDEQKNIIENLESYISRS